MAHTPGGERDEARRLLAEARAAHREADRERARARKLAGRLARRLRHTLAAARAQIDADRERVDADRAAIDAKIARLNEARSEFHAAEAADRDRLRGAWADLEARQRRLAAEWEEANRFQGEQAAALAARAAELAAGEKAEADSRAKAQRATAALREEAAALEVRVANARAAVEELERRRAELYAEVAAPAAEPPVELQVALDRAADRDLTRWAAELDAREARLRQERAAVQALLAAASKDKAELADRRRVLAEQFAQLAAARAQWQEAERVTVAEMEQLAAALRRREAELDARQQLLARADSRRREDAYELWQLRLRLEAWQSKIVAYELRWHTERHQIEADLARREAELTRWDAPDAGADDDIPMALPLHEPEPELAALRGELDRLAAVLLEAEPPEPPDPPESELPWGSEDVPEAIPGPGDDSAVILFAPAARAA